MHRTKCLVLIFFFFSSRRRHTRWPRDWSSDVCSSDLSDCLYVGKTDNLRRRLAEHLSNPPVAGATQFFAEVLASEQHRAEREAALLLEFQPPKNAGILVKHH